MFRLLRFFILLLVIVAIVAGAYLWMARVPTMERFLSKKLNTTVTIEKVHLGWKTLSIEGLKIANPEQSAIPYAFQGEVTAIEMNPLALLKKTVHIDRIEIHNPTIGIELYNNSGTDNNWSRILNGLPSGGERKFIVKKLVVINLKFEAARSNGKTISLPAIPYLEFANLGEKGALTLPQLGRVIFQIILQNIANKPHLGAILENVASLPKDIMDGVTSTLPLDEAKGAIQEGFDAIRRKTQEASEFLQDLFSFVPRRDKFSGN